MRKLEPCVGPAHIWEEGDILAACELCGDHYGFLCTVPGCYEQVDGIWDIDLYGKIEAEIKENRA